jgi:hypothetical protein
MKVSKIGDIIAIPCFLTSFLYYQYVKPPANCVEHFLVLFFLAGFIADILFISFNL